MNQSVAHDYDDTGRLLTKTFENDEQEFFHWDANGNLTGVQSPGAMVERFYDTANRLIAEKSGEFVVEYHYDRTGRRTQRTTSHGNTVQYDYDASGAVSAIQINDQAPITIQRDQFGRITSEQFSDHLGREFGYNEAGLLSRQTITGDAGRIERLYDYDPTGNLIARKDSHKGPWQFTYDPMGRITEALDPERQVHRFGYDKAGDLVDHLPDTGQGLRTARYNQTEYRYNAAGKLAERQTNDDLTRFTWDEQNRLIAAQTPDDQRIDMTYDALGRRRIKAVNGERTFFTWDGDALLSEQYEDQSPREYVYYPGTFEPLALIDGEGQVYYYHNDLNGLPQELTRSNGEIVWSASYDSMGRVDQFLVDEVAQPLRFQGQYWNAEIDLCYNRYRYYDPQICSFISQDPLGLVAGDNVYAYAPNVWGWVDPLGLKCEDTANIYHYPGSATNPYGHYSIETINNNKPLHTHQVITELDRSNTKIVNILDSPPSKAPDKIVEVKLPNAEGAQLYQKSMIGKELGPYDQKTNSCVDHVSEVLRAAGTDVPKSALGQYKHLKGIGF